MEMSVRGRRRIRAPAIGGLAPDYEGNLIGAGISAAKERSAGIKLVFEIVVREVFGVLCRENDGQKQDAHVSQADQQVLHLGGGSFRAGVPGTFPGARKNQMQVEEGFVVCWRKKSGFDGLRGQQVSEPVDGDSPFIRLLPRFWTGWCYVVFAGRNRPGLKPDSFKCVSNSATESRALTRFGFGAPELTGWSSGFEWRGRGHR